MLNELFEALFPFSKADNFLVDTSITETCCGKSSDRAYGTHSGGIPSFERMEGDNPESIPAGSEEGEESQG
jgi:hypothetical protein